MQMKFKKIHSPLGFESRKSKVYSDFPNCDSNPRFPSSSIGRAFLQCSRSPGFKSHFYSIFIYKAVYLKLI